MKKIALLFSGQGSQYVGMGKWLCEDYKIANDTFNEASEILGINLKKVCFEYSDFELSKTMNSQIAIFTTSIAMFRVYIQQFGIIPHILAGHSLGELSALTCANAMCFEDGLKIVQNRANFMNEVCKQIEGGMIAVSGLERKVIEEECRNRSNSNQLVAVSNYNSTNQIIVSGHKNLINVVVSSLMEKGADIKELNVSGAFHSPLMYPAAYRMQQKLKEFHFNDFRWTVISNVTGQPYNGKKDLNINLTAQIVKPVQWIETVNFLREAGINNVIELGPKSILKRLIKTELKEINCYSFDSKNDIETFKKQIYLKEKPYIKNLLTKCITSAVAMKNNTFNNTREYKKAEIQFIKITSLLYELEGNKRLPTEEENIEAMEMLKAVFTAKGIPNSEREKRINEIISETGTAYIFKRTSIPSI